MLKKLHHVAYRCRDAAETTHFYVDLLGLKLLAVLEQDFIPSLQREEPHAHIFFEMEDGSCVAFFDILGDDGPYLLTSDDWAQHLALEADAERAGKIIDRLVAADVPVLGPVDHGFCTSYYFRDPNGHRLEIAIPVENHGLTDHERDAAASIRRWQARKAAAEARAE